MLQNSEKIFAGIETAYSSLSGDGEGAVSALGNAMHSLQSISQYSGQLNTISEEITDMYYRLEDLSSSLRETREKFTFTPEDGRRHCSAQSNRQSEEKIRLFH